MTSFSTKITGGLTKRLKHSGIKWGNGQKSDEFTPTSSFIDLDCSLYRRPCLLQGHYPSGKVVDADQFVYEVYKAMGKTQFYTTKLSKSDLEMLDNTGIVWIRGGELPSEWTRGSHICLNIKEDSIIISNDDLGEKVSNEDFIRIAIDIAGKKEKDMNKEEVDEMTKYIGQMVYVSDCSREVALRGECKRKLVAILDDKYSNRFVAELDRDSSTIVLWKYAVPIHTSREMTVAEIEKALGYSVKVIK
jgi:hypothetical protein